MKCLTDTGRGLKFSFPGLRPPLSPENLPPRSFQSSHSRPQFSYLEPLPVHHSFQSLPAVPSYNVSSPSLDHVPLSLEWRGGCENGEGAKKKRLVEMICLYGGVRVEEMYFLRRKTRRTFAILSQYHACLDFDTIWVCKQRRFETEARLGQVKRRRRNKHLPCTPPTPTREPSSAQSPYSNVQPAVRGSCPSSRESSGSRDEVHSESHSSDAIRFRSPFSAGSRPLLYHTWKRHRAR